MKGTQLALAVQLRDTASFANYWPGHNADVVAALRELQHPTLLYGPTQSGRTHLLQAVCRERSGGYLPLREVLAYGPEALQGFEQQPLLVPDAIDALADQRAWEIGRGSGRGGVGKDV